jgi:hypothetical protein
MDSAIRTSVKLGSPPNDQMIDNVFQKPTGCEVTAVNGPRSRRHHNVSHLAPEL